MNSQEFISIAHFKKHISYIVQNLSKINKNHVEYEC